MAEIRTKRWEQGNKHIQYDVINEALLDIDSN